MNEGTLYGIVMNVLPLEKTEAQKNDRQARNYTVIFLINR